MVDLLEMLGVKPSVIQGAAAGGVIAFVLGTGTRVQKAARAGAGMLFASIGTQGLVEMASRWIPDTPAVLGLTGLILGITGIYIAELLTRIAGRARDRSDAIADAGLDRVAPRSSREEPPHAP